jgi:hypothetical protein
MVNDRDGDTPRVAQCLTRPIPAVLPFAFLLLLSSGSAQAWIVAATGTTVNPATYPGWTQGDPGWENIAQSGPNYVYLGDRWMLSARHVGVSDATFSTGTFSPVAGENYIIHNPPPSLAGGLSLTTETDLRLIRIAGDPGPPALTIASQSPPSAGSSGSEIMFIGQGRARQASETRWQVNTSNPQDWMWSVVTSGGNFRGYLPTGSPVKQWGTNRLASTASYQNVFSHTLSSTTGVFPLKTPDGITRDVFSMLTSFDQQGQNGALPFEAQGISGNSGSAVLYKNGSQWQLAGVVNSVLIYNSQWDPVSEGGAGVSAVYGNVTTFADLSYYNKPYQGSICDVMKVCGNYSIVGDVNLDGVVSGDGSGIWQNDDVKAFVDGWRFDNGAGAGNYDSWTHGDMNHDGKTDVADFFLLRGALNGPISGATIDFLFSGQSPPGGGSLVPEPSTTALTIVVAALLGFTMHRRHGSLTRQWCH